MFRKNGTFFFSNQNNHKHSESQWLNLNSTASCMDHHGQSKWIKAV